MSSATSRCQNRFRSFRISLLALDLGLALNAAAQNSTYDLVIQGGQIVDGSGNPWYYGDLAIDQGRIVVVGQLGELSSERVIDASGFVVALGFIDLHNHTNLLGNGRGESKFRQGVTLDVIGEGNSVAPPDGLPETSGWTIFTGYYALLDAQAMSSRRSWSSPWASSMK
jgi:N-acyl-D-amino-acid deacylase